MMDRSAILKIIVETVDGYRLAMLGPGVTLDGETRLFGAGGILDSLGLVSVLVELEQRVSDASGQTVSLMDDRAMSEASSPFRTVNSLADYLQRQLALRPTT